MKTETNQNLYNLIRAYMHALGTSRTTVVALRSYIDAIQRLHCTIDNFRPMLEELNTVIKNTKPKLVPLVHLIEAFEAQMASLSDLSLEAAKKRAVEILTQKLEHFETATAKVTVQCMNCIAPGDLIIAHSSTAYIRDALVRAHTELEREFKVLVLKHDFIRTKALVDDLERHQVDHILIPEYNLSHYLSSAWSNGGKSYPRCRDQVVSCRISYWFPLCGSWIPATRCSLLLRVACCFKL